MSTERPGWGRRSQASWTRGIVSAGFMLLCPMMTFLPFVALEHHEGSIGGTLGHLASQPRTLFAQYFPRAALTPLLVYSTWIAFQALLYTVIPGRICLGPRTPAGNVLGYRINGIQALAVTLAVFACLSLGRVINPAWIADNWEPLLLAVNVYGLLLGVLAYAKALYWPSHPADAKFSGPRFYDLYMGIELNPRLGKSWDVKLFHIGRGGMMAWLFVDLSFTAHQYQRYGYVTNSIIIIDVLHALYVVDFFVKESWQVPWYLKTIDIEHDHFGFYLSWGSAAFLPTTYTLQAQYIAKYPSQLDPWKQSAIIAIGVLGYVIFRSANDQKLASRQSPDTCRIWGQAPTCIKCYYKTSDDALHESSLLCSGWWGVVRHANYLGDLLLSFASCAACNTAKVLPWSYAIFMSVLLAHRCIRDEIRCSVKYGKSWEEYCRRVQWRIIPGVF